MMISTIDLSSSTFKLTLEAFMGWKVVSFEAKKHSLLQESTACILQTSIHVALLYAFEYCHFSTVIWSISHLKFFFVLHLHSLLDQISHKISTWQKQWHHWMDHQMDISTQGSLAKAVGSFNFLFWSQLMQLCGERKSHFRESLSHSVGTSPYFNLFSPLTY